MTDREQDLALDDYRSALRAATTLLDALHTAEPGSETARVLADRLAQSVTALVGNAGYLADVQRSNDEERVAMNRFRMRMIRGGAP